MKQERGDKTFATKLVEDFPGVHKANILSISFSHDASRKMIATGSTDRSVKLTDYSDGQVIHQFDSDFSSAVISLDFNPNQEFKYFIPLPIMILLANRFMQTIITWICYGRKFFCSGC
jgi:WD40 repeat protein